MKSKKAHPDVFNICCSCRRRLSDRFVWPPVDFKEYGGHYDLQYRNRQIRRQQDVGFDGVEADSSFDGMRKKIWMN